MYGEEHAFDLHSFIKVLRGKRFVALGLQSVGHGVFEVLGMTGVGR